MKIFEMYLEMDDSEFFTGKDLSEVLRAMMNKYSDQVSLAGAGTIRDLEGNAIGNYKIRYESAT